MKKILKHNKIYFLIFIFALAIMLISTLNDTNIFYIVKNFIFDSEYRNNFTLAESNIAYDISLWEVIKRVLGGYEWNYDTMIIWGTYIFQIILPIFGAIGSLIIYQKKSTIYHFSYHKSNNYKSFLLKETMKEGFKISISVFLSYLVFYVICLTVSQGTYNTSVTRNFLLDILGNNFYLEHMRSYYLLTGFLKFFLVNYLYIFFSLSIGLNVNNNKNAFFQPLIWYYAFTLIASILVNGISQNFVYLSPALIMMFDYYNGLHSLFVFIIPIFFGIMGYFIIKRGTKNVEI